MLEGNEAFVLFNSEIVFFFLVYFTVDTPNRSCEIYIKRVCLLVSPSFYAINNYELLTCRFVIVKCNILIKKNWFSKSFVGFAGLENVTKY